MTVTVCTTAYT